VRKGKEFGWLGEPAADDSQRFDAGDGVALVGPDDRVEAELGAQERELRDGKSKALDGRQVVHVHAKSSIVRGWRDGATEAEEAQPYA